MTSVREKRPGVWEVRVFTGADDRGRPTQLSRTVHGGKRDALRVAAELAVGPGQSSPAGRTVADVLDAWVDQNIATWAPSSTCDQQSRVRGIKKDPIARLPLARVSVGDVERWHTRLRKAGYRDAGIKNQHGVSFVPRSRRPSDGDGCRRTLRRWRVSSRRSRRRAA